MEWTRANRTRLIVAAVIFGSVFFFTSYRGHPERPRRGARADRTTTVWLDRIRGAAKHGFWLAVRGTHPGDQVVAAASAGELTHAVVYDRTRDEIIEAVGAGVRVTSLRALIADATRVQVIEPPGYDEIKGASAVDRARTVVGASYDWLGTIGFPRERHFYCTELAVWSYRGREQGWLIRENVLHPAHLHELGRLVSDTGRPASPFDLPTSLRPR